MLRVDSDKLKILLGQSLTYQDMPCQVIEILADESALVLRDRHDHKIIHPNQYGDAGDRLPRTFTVAVLNTHRDGFNPDLPELATFDLLI
ncbi:MAG TPA: hypothetical protein PKY50_03370 [Candidatus Competibacter sp.]|nr:hypothetical protein [Candidatus Competibacter sp.]